MSVIETQGFKLDNSGKRIVVDPVTRIEGHLRIEANLDDKNVIRNAVSTGTMWRGLEVILKGRDPRDAWAFVERICGVCTGTHALVSVRAVEDALKIKIPDNANIIRNLMHATLYAHDHLVHFYHLHALDWVDVVSALSADPKKTSELAQSISSWPMSSPGYFRDLQSRLKKFVASGQLGPFRNGYWGHPAYKLPAEANLMAVAHYLEALDFQKEIVKIQTVFGGKNPHPNWLVGGVPCSINMERHRRHQHGAAEHGVEDHRRHHQLHRQRLHPGPAGHRLVLQGLGRHRRRHLQPEPDVLRRVPRHRQRRQQQEPADAARRHRQRQADRDPAGGPEGPGADPGVRAPTAGTSTPTRPRACTPSTASPKPNFVLGKGIKGTPTAIDQLDESAKYSWVKSPRWRGHAMEVGPLARYVIGYAMGKPEFKEPVDMVLKKLDVPLPALFSTLGRTAARGLEASWAAHKMRYFFDKLMANLKAGDFSTANVDSWEPSTWPAAAQGAGYCEAPRGALGHWIKIKDTRIDNYQCVVPTTWNASPRDTKNQIGAYEAALMNTPMAKPDEPLEILRTIHSFDPCLACATHVISPEGEEITRVTVR